MRNILLYLTLVQCISCFGQKQANIWYFGFNAGLDFSSGTPVPLLDGAMTTFEGCATISDADGNLLFYTDGINVYNRDHMVMQNGNGLAGNPSSTHSAIIVPKPSDPNIYYIFTVDSHQGSNGLQYSEVDMTLDNGLGGITSNKNILLETAASEKITAVRSSVGNEYWVVSHREGNNEFMAYKVFSTGIDMIPVVSAVGSIPGGERGQIKISPDGTKLAMAGQRSDQVELYDFNATTGEVSNPISIDDVFAAYGLEFSPNSKLLYFGTVFGNFYQCNLEAGSPTDIINSIIQLEESTQNGFFGSLQLANDGKIYIAKTNEENLDVIENPNIIGLGSNYIPNGVSLGGRIAWRGLPTFIQSFFNVQLLFTGVCFGDVTNFSLSETVDSAAWDFGDPASGANNTSTDLAPSHVFTAPGVYTVTVEVVLGTETETFSTEVEIFDLPSIIEAPNDIQVCNPDSNGIEIFDFSPQAAQILGMQDPAIFEVVFALDANFNIPIPDPTNYTNTNPNETIYYRINNRRNTNCGPIDFFQISVFDEANFPPSIDNYQLCDDDLDGDDSNGFVSSFLLSTRDADVLNGLDPADYQVNYFVTENDAINNTNPIDKTIPYQNSTANSQTIYVRVNYVESNVCANTDLQFDLIVNPLPTVTPLVELRQCDDDTDGFSLFNLNEAAQEISSNFLNESFTFYPSLADAQNDTNAIANPTAYQNQTVTIDRVWARTMTNAGCYRISEVSLIVSTTGIPSTFQPTFTECDDFLDINGDDNANNDSTDGITSFDFSAVTADVEALFPISQQLIITYYTNEADALAEQNAIPDPSNYRNISSPITQQIYIRVDSQLDNDCLGLGPFLTLNVEPVPIANSVSDIELCDDDSDGDAFNGQVEGFNLDAQTASILGSQNPGNFTVSYHVSFNEALQGVNAITNTSSYENIVPNQQTIYVRVFDNTTGCFSSQTSFDLIVNPLPIANPVSNLEVCDDNTDGSAQNGFAQTFNLESQTSDVLGGQDPNEFTVTYHASLADAEQGVLPLLTPFSNSVPFSQTIYVRVSNQTTGCANGITSFEVIVNPEPMALEISNVSECDDDMDGFDTNGIIQTFDLDNEIEAILGPNQSPNDYTVTFHSTQANATSGNAPLISPYQNSQADQQTIYVRVVNNATGCVNDDLTFELIVNPLPTFTVNPFEIICLNELPLTLEIQSSLTIYDYVWEDDQGTTFMGEEIEIRRGGTYSVTATSTDGTSCSRTQEIFVQESNVANITAEDITIIDDSDNNSIRINPTNLGIGDYEYAIQNNTGFSVPFQDEPFFDNLEGGIYTIFVRDKNNCGTTSISVPVVQFPKFFTPNNDSRNDTWNAKGFNSTFFPGSQIFIFNRYGKQLAELDIDGDGWNGLFNSRPMPSDDYWYLVKIAIPNGPVEERQGHFSLLRK